MLTTKPNKDFYFQYVSLLGCAVSICSVCVVKLMKLFSKFAGVFFYLQRVELSQATVGVMMWVNTFYETLKNGNMHVSRLMIVFIWTV